GGRGGRAERHCLDVMFGRWWGGRPRPQPAPRPAFLSRNERAVRGPAADQGGPPHKFVFILRCVPRRMTIHCPAFAWVPRQWTTAAPEGLDWLLRMPRFCSIVFVKRYSVS